MIARSTIYAASCLPQIRVGLFLLLLSPNACQGQFFQPANQDVIHLYLFRGQSESQFRAKIDNQARIRVERISGICQLNEKQIKKLNWAVQGDVARFFREVSNAREQTKNLNVQVQEEMQQAWQIVSPLYQRAQTGVLDDESLFAKILASALDEEQALRLDQYEAEQRQRVFHAVIDATISDIDRLMPLTSKQRTALIKLLHEQPVPKKLPMQMESYLGYAAICRLESKELKTILDAKQLELVNNLRAQYEGIVPQLR
ncbi:MAG: hypothetical protein KDB22_07930 [Planctomycetales bacterium]|nr:hypothetical protein [Planctomycetales bacterium]